MTRTYATRSRATQCAANPDNLELTEKERIAKRQHNMRDDTRAHEQLAEPGDGPSRNKGKGINPRNWRNIDFSDDNNLRADAQDKAYNEWKARQYCDKHNRPAYPFGQQYTPAPNPSTAEDLNCEILNELREIRAKNAWLHDQQAVLPLKPKHARLAIPQADPVSISQGIASKATKGALTQGEQAHLLPSRC
ncbi:hypothetical protein BDN71DRAFT_1522335 [Pleurotus eryngii]|uniref:Uncharacterized protein n=1 Tax=Pleurotus eryngii TaxID=5323 RepID=A0A9P6A474_PLEER|nr:hypothetical protein BDN71DRAFT_1522335 [Pleurotus eryngii]